LEIHEFVCDDCQTDVFSFGGDPAAKLCSCCQTVREINARFPMTPADEARLREILGCVIPVRKGAEPGTMIMDISCWEQAAKDVGACGDEEDGDDALRSENHGSG
jgi:hypothetical protein